MPKATNTKAVTKAVSFFSCNSDQAPLFSVNPGIPVADALMMVSCLLEDARAAHEKSESEPSFAANRLVEMAKAVVDSVVEGLEFEGGAA